MFRELFEGNMLNTTKARRRKTIVINILIVVVQFSINFLSTWYREFLEMIIVYPLVKQYSDVVEPFD